MRIRVTCPPNFGPKLSVTGVFREMADALEWAEYGHTCVGAELHAFVSTAPPPSEATANRWLSRPGYEESSTVVVGPSKWFAW